MVSWCFIGSIVIAASVSTIRTPDCYLALILSGTLAGGMLGAFNSKSIGLTGPAFGLDAALTSREVLRSYFRGRNIALAVTGVPLHDIVPASALPSVRY